MEEARKKIRLCLLIVVLVAVCVGVIYYFQEVKEKHETSDGVLVFIESSATPNV